MSDNPRAPLVLPSSPQVDSVETSYDVSEGTLTCSFSMPALVRRRGAVLDLALGVESAPGPSGAGADIRTALAHKTMVPMVPG